LYIRPKNKNEGGALRPFRTQRRGLEHRGGRIQGLVSRKEKKMITVGSKKY